MLSWTSLLGVTLIAGSAYVTLPQLAHTLRTRNLAGLALPSQLAWTASWALWLTYSLEVSAAVKGVGDAIGLAFDAVLLGTFLLVARTAGQSPTLLLVRSSWVLLPVPVLLAASHLWGPAALAVGLALYDGAALGPQVRAVVTSPSLAGLSLTSWTARCLTYTGWIAYGIGIGHPESGAWAVVMLPVAVFVCWRIHRDTRRRHTFHPVEATHDLTPHTRELATLA